MEKIITLEENLKFIYETAAKEVLNYTPQLFVLMNNTSTSLKPFASGVLFYKNEDYYLITAAHCVKQSKGMIKIGVIISGDFHLIKGFVCMAPGKDNKIDLAIIRLKIETVKTLKRAYQFIKEKSIIMSKNIPDETEYLIVGFPNSKTAIDYKKRKIKTEPLVYISKSENENKYLKLKVNKRTNTLLVYNRRKSTFVSENEMNMSPVPDGISGCGLWYIPSYITDKPVPKLSGIMTEYFDKDNMMLATKIEAALQMISLLNEGNFKPKK